mgnify:FL=1
MKDQCSLIADTLHGSIVLSSYEKEVMTTVLFNRLHGISQNSTAYLTFPSNRTKRAEHSFGTMYLCGNLFYSSICNADEKDLNAFLTSGSDEISAILTKLRDPAYGRQYESKLGGLFQNISREYKALSVSGGIYNYFTPANIDDPDFRRIYQLLFEGVRTAALLHDIGHPPFSHICENALNTIKSDLSAKTEKSKEEEEFLKIVGGDATKSEDIKLHEELGIAIANLILMSIIPDITERQARNTDSYQSQLHKILIKEIVLCILTGSSSFFQDVHSVISGTLDGDRLDYVSRDPANSGVLLGTTEYDRLIYKMKLCTRQDHFLFCPGVSAVKTVEDFLMRRWNMYKNIIYHHRVIKTDSLLQNIIVSMARDYFKTEHTYENTSYILPYDISGLWRANKMQPSSLEQTYALSQWDDSWLLTILKKSYFEEYIDHDDYIHDQLEEFLTNHKNYYSLIKRKEDFQELDTAVAKVLETRSGELRNVITELREKQKDVKEDKDTESKTNVDIQGYLNIIEEILSLVSVSLESESTGKGNHGFILCAVKSKLFPKKIDDCMSILEQMEKRVSQDPGQIFCALRAPSTGTGKELYFWQPRENGSDTLPLSRISNITNVLDNDLRFTPFIFIYISKKYYARQTFSDIRKEMGTCIGEVIADSIQNKISSFL